MKVETEITHGNATDRMLYLSAGESEPLPSSPKKALVGPGIALIRTHEHGRRELLFHTCAVAFARPDAPKLSLVAGGAS